ncbi:DUF3472 domain-containing protein [Spirosoma pomorum]
MIRLTGLYVLALLLLTYCSTVFPLDTVDSHLPNVVRVPVGGNSWLSPSSSGSAKLGANGLTNWTETATKVTAYVRFDKAGQLTVSVRLNVPEGNSRIRVTLLGKSQDVDVQGAASRDYTCGQWTIPKAGYVPITLEGVRKTGAVFADVTDFGISGDAVDERTAFVRNNEDNFFYWGRRGPSVHLRYAIPESVDPEWFYNEITVPASNDVVGSYYMANGFGEGYFGMQVNSPTERRVLFSVWSPFHTDDPSQIPDNQKIRLDRKGPAVVTNDFGNEGSGGQSFLRYNWQAGQTYQFLLRGVPIGDGYSQYTAYFKPANEPNWQLIASFKRPQTTTYLKSLYSFLENFSPETGNIQREAAFGNQWIRTKTGQWREITTAQFTGDNTARKAYRMDYAGGLSGQQFFLRNCGFFATYTPLKTDYKRPAHQQPPVIDITALP